MKRDGFTATGKGRVGKLTTDVELDVSGDLAYDLAKLEPQLKQYLGKMGGGGGQGHEAVPHRREPARRREEPDSGGRWQNPRARPI